MESSSLNFTSLGKVRLQRHAISCNFCSFQVLRCVHPLESLREAAALRPCAQSTLFLLRVLVDAAVVDLTDIVRHQPLHRREVYSTATRDKFLFFYPWFTLPL